MATQSDQATTQLQYMEKVASGQKLVLWAVLLNLITYGLTYVIGDIALLLGIGAIVLSLVGLFKLASGLAYSTGAAIGFLILLFIPLIGLITLLVLNSKATKALRAAGYKVGLFGASR